MGKEAYECVGGPLDGQRVVFRKESKGVFSRQGKLPSGEYVKHWYMLLTRVDTIRQECVMFFSYRGTDRSTMLTYPIVAPACNNEEV